MSSPYFQPQHPAYVRPVLDGPWLKATLAHRTLEGLWLAELENGALVEVGPHEIRIRADDVPDLLQSLASDVEKITASLEVIPASERNSRWSSARKRLVMAYGDLMDAAQQLEVSA